MAPPASFAARALVSCLLGLPLRGSAPRNRPNSTSLHLAHRTTTHNDNNHAPYRPSPLYPPKTNSALTIFSPTPHIVLDGDHLTLAWVEHSFETSRSLSAHDIHGAPGPLLFQPLASPFSALKSADRSTPNVSPLLPLAKPAPSFNTVWETPV